MWSQTQIRTEWRTRSDLTMQTSKVMTGYIRSMVDADENRMAQRLVKHLARTNHTVKYICQKEFQSIDKTIKLDIDVLIEDGDKLHVGEGKTQLGRDALRELNVKLDKIRGMVVLDGAQGDAGVFSGKKLVPFLFGRTWVSSGVPEQANDSEKGKADLAELVKEAAEQGVPVLFPDGEDLGSCVSCYPGHSVSVPDTARNVRASAGAPQQATVMRGPPLSLRVQVRQQPVQYRMPSAHGMKPGGCKVGGKLNFLW